MAYTNRAVAKSASDIPGSIADATMAIQHDAHYARAYASRGISHCMRRDFDASIADLTRAEQLDPKLRIFAARALAKHLKGDDAGAIADYGKAIDLEPQSPDRPKWENRIRELKAAGKGK